MPRDGLSSSYLLTGFDYSIPQVCEQVQVHRYRDRYVSAVSSVTRNAFAVRASCHCAGQSHRFMGSAIAQALRGLDSPWKLVQPKAVWSCSCVGCHFPLGVRIALDARRHVYHVRQRARHPQACNAAASSLSSATESVR